MIAPLSVTDELGGLGVPDAMTQPVKGDQGTDNKRPASIEQIWEEQYLVHSIILLDETGGMGNRGVSWTLLRTIIRSLNWRHAPTS